MSVSWLQRQRKQNLLDLSNEVGLPQNGDTLKDDIIQALDAHLRANSDQYSREPKLSGYFGGRSSTPFKPRASFAVGESSSGEDAVKSAVKARGRRPTKVKQENEEPVGVPSSPEIGATTALAATSSPIQRSPLPTSAVASPSPIVAQASQTPAPQKRRASQLPGPPSPSVVADVVEQEVTRAYARVGRFYTGTGITEMIEYLRETCSSVIAVQTTFLLLEAYALQRHLMPWRYVLDVPGVPALGVGPTAVFLPDLFVILTGWYWSTTLLWLGTSVIVPALFGYFFNLTLREVRRSGSAQTQMVARHASDPLSFNIVKALTTWLVYNQGISFGVIDAVVAEHVDQAIYGGHTAVLIGSAIGVLAALYDAALRK